MSEKYLKVQGVRQVDDTFVLYIFQERCMFYFKRDCEIMRQLNKNITSATLEKF